MKRITAMLMAMAFAAVSLTGCSNSSTSSENVSGISSEQDSFFTASSTTVPEETSQEKDNSIITADTREELAKGFLEAIIADDKDTILRYNVSKKIYVQISEAVSQAKERAGLNESDELSLDDFEIYIYGANYSAVGSAADTVYGDILSPKLSSFSYSFTIQYDYDTEKYTFKRTSDSYRYAYSASSNSEYAQNGFDSYYDYCLTRLKKAQKI